MNTSIRGAPWRWRWVPLVVAALGTSAAGCGGDDSGGDAKGAGGGGAGGAGLDLQVEPVTDGKARLPMDATPDPDATAVYFVASNEDGNGVFKVTLADKTQSVVFVGDPFSVPTGITISDDGKTLYVADPSADSGANDAGQIFALPTGGGSPTALSGAEGKGARGLVAAGDKLYFSGRAGGVAGVYTIPLAGGAPTKLVEGGSLVDPAGLAVAKSGDVFVLDAVGEQSSGPVLLKISGGVATVLHELQEVGFPAGVALSTDDKTVFVSAFDPGKGKNVVFVIDAASGQAVTFDKTIGEFAEGAGLHRAKNKDVFAWADSKAGGNGTVFVLQK